MYNMYINIENTIFQDFQDVNNIQLNPKILLEEFKCLHAQSVILEQLNKKPNKLR